MTAGDVDQDTARAFHRAVLQQRVVDRRFGGVDRAGVAGGLAGSHHGFTHFAHHRADVGEVEVDQARHDHQIGDTANARVKHVIGHVEGVGESGLVIGHAEQVLIWNDDQRVDIALQFLNPGLGRVHPVAALEMKRLGHHPDG